MVKSKTRVPTDTLYSTRTKAMVVLYYIALRCIVRRIIELEQIFLGLWSLIYVLILTGINDKKSTLHCHD